MAAELEVLHVVAGLHPAAGGPSRTVVRLADSLAFQPLLKVGLLSQALRGDPQVPSANSSVRRVVPMTGSSVALQFGLPVRSALRVALTVGQPDLVHGHGIWLPANHWGCKAVTRGKLALVTHPRGMLEPWSLRFRGWKKRLALSLYQRRDLESNALFFATSTQEAESIRAFGLRQPIAVIPNGVDFPASITEGQKSDGVRTALFLGRIHPIKGLLPLVEAWARVQPAGWRLVIAGPDEIGHLHEVVCAISNRRLAEHVQYVGPVEGAQKEAWYRAADLFVLPSFSENFGVVVAEAMAHGLPVITTHGTPWSDVVVRGCGWWVAPTTETLAEAIREAVDLDDGQRIAMGEKARSYAHEFDWSYIARQTMAVYNWVLGRGARPACVWVE